MVTNKDMQQARLVVTLLIAVGRQIVQPAEVIQDSITRGVHTADVLKDDGLLGALVEAVKS